MTPTDTKIEDFAEELGKLLGTAQAKAEDWLNQRTQITKTLEGIRDTATKLLTDLGQQAQQAYRGARRGRPPGSGKRGPGRPAGSGKPGRPKGRQMSPEARAKIAAAQKKRWAKQKAADKKKSA